MLCQVYPSLVVSELRYLFCTILIAQGAPARLLWNETRDSLAADFLVKYPDDVELAYNYALRRISRILALHGRTLHDEGSPQRLPDANELYQAFPPARTTRRRPSGS